MQIYYTACPKDSLCLGDILLYHRNKNTAVAGLGLYVKRWVRWVGAGLELPNLQIFGHALKQFTLKELFNILFCISPDAVAFKKEFGVINLQVSPEDDPFSQK
jgi:hypothetical protein